jgi:hypothetical protein
MPTCKNRSRRAVNRAFDGLNEALRPDDRLEAQSTSVCEARHVRALFGVEVAGFRVVDDDRVGGLLRGQLELL